MARKVLSVIMLVLFTLTLIYPVVATPIRHYKADFSLDGMQFMKYYSVGDYEAVKWLRDKDGNIVEAFCDCYSYCSRISTFSGNPTIVAWACHEVKWRGNGRELVERINDVRKIYVSNCNETLELLKKYNVKYVVVGKQERKIYKDVKNFEKCGLKKVFEYDGTAIFEVNN